ncbi:MFS allantoate transporter [Trichophyton equinum CBS 127.97]|uniref:MFS allantoate transporter n=1 Tax=Trichophyton equinum (strain ATCC MYA-4606 / CBS 127.97) TaxID=559882 RepID=F2Q173_TRIEC|nr:MFS allantoate transporter [Trichophyton equinum CBS 127.97]
MRPVGPSPPTMIRRVAIKCHTLTHYKLYHNAPGSVDSRVVDVRSIAKHAQNALAFAAVLGMNKDLGLHGQQYSWLGSIFNIAYLFAEFPTSWLLTRLPIGKYVGTSLILWGAAGSAMAACTNFASAAAVRFLLGALESAILPSVIVIMSTWYRREEQPLRAALCFGPFSGIFGGILAYAIGTLRAPIPTWKLIFLIYGAITIAVGFICLVVLPDNHDKAIFLSKGEREQAKLRVADIKPAETHARNLGNVSVSENRIAALMGVYLTGFYNIAWSMALSLVASNTAGATKKSFVSASIAIAHGVGGLVGPQFFLDSQKPQYQLGLGAMIASLIMMAVCGIVYGALCVYQNKARDNLGESTSPLPAECCSAEEHIDGETDDRTDREMHSFRYTY